MAVSQRKKRLRQTAQRKANGEYDLDEVFNREIYPAINSIEEIVAGAEGAILQTRGGLLTWYGPGGTGSLLQTFSNGLPTWTTSLPANENRSLIWDPTTSQWAADNHSFRPVVPTSGIGTPNILLSFTQRSLADTSGNGLNATVEAGTERYTYFTPTIGGFLFDGATALTVTGSQALLALTGEITVALCVIINTRGAQQFLIGYEDLQETEADNTLWSLFYEADGSITFISESGAGVNATHSVNSYCELGQPSLIGFTRYADGSMQHFLNRGVWGTQSGVLPPPTGGGNARFRIGGREALTAPFQGTMCSVVVWPRSVTATEWAQQIYNPTLGFYSGFVP